MERGPFPSFRQECRCLCTYKTNRSDLQGAVESLPGLTCEALFLRITGLGTAHLKKSGGVLMDES